MRRLLSADRMRSASMFEVVSVQAQYMPATSPCSSTPGEYEKVNQVASS